MRWILLAALALAACNSSDNSPTAPPTSNNNPPPAITTIRAGTYQGQINMAGYMMANQHVFTADRNYGWQVVDGGCTILVRVGKWSYANNTLQITEATTSGRTSCSEPLAQIGGVGAFTFEVRNLAASSFDLHYPPSGTSLSQWVSYSAI